VNLLSISNSVEFFIIGLVIGIIGGCTGGIKIHRAECVSAGVAKWTVNPTNGEKNFIFIKP